MVEARSGLAAFISIPTYRFIIGREQRTGMPPVTRDLPFFIAVGGLSVSALLIVALLVASLLRIGMADATYEARSLKLRSYSFSVSRVLTKQVRLTLVAGGALYFGILARYAWAEYRLSRANSRAHGLHLVGLQDSVTLWRTVSIVTPLVGYVLFVALRWALRDEQPKTVPSNAVSRTQISRNPVSRSCAPKFSPS
jgi:hypothetical protein